MSNIGVGCHWEGFFAGALCYADDIVLLAPSPAALRILLRCCESFAASHNLVLTLAKQLIRFSIKPSTLYPAKICFCNQLLPFSDSVCHIGHTLKFNLSDDDDVLIRSRDLVKKANHLLVSFAGVGPGILTRLFQCFCLSLYDAALWTLNCPAIKSLEISFNKILRRIWSLPARSHTTIVHHVARLPSLFNLIRSRSLCCVPPTYALPILFGLSSINLSVVIRSVALTLSLDNVISSTVINNMLNVQT